MEFIRTGSVGIDIALGGGWRPGTMNEVWGDSGSGKTTLAKHAVENTVRLHEDVLWLDLDGTARYMDGMPGMILGSPRNAEQAFMMAYHACYEPAIGLIVFDPAQLLVRQRELDNDPDYTPHPQREYRGELNELKEAAKITGTTVLFLSQPRDHQREPIRGTGISEKVAYRVHLHPDVIHQDGTRDIVATVKRPDKSVVHNAAEFTVLPGKGIDKARELVTVAVEKGIIQKRGSWLYYGQIKVQGVDDMAHLLRVPRSRYPHLIEDDIRRMAGIS